VKNTLRSSLSPPVIDGHYQIALSRLLAGIPHFVRPNCVGWEAVSAIADGTGARDAIKLTAEPLSSGSIGSNFYPSHSRSFSPHPWPL
jgi:hypothetical protein